jgi:hypothetical protein
MYKNLPQADFNRNAAAAKISPIYVSEIFHAASKRQGKF